MRPETQLRALPCAVIDVETTGIDPLVGHVVQIAVAHVTLGVEDARVAFTSIVRPPIPIPPESTKFHGLDDDRVKDAPSFAEIADQVIDACAGRLPVAFNAPFDFRYLWKELAAAEREAGCPPWPWLDEYVLVRCVDKYERGKKLLDVAARRGIVLDAHSAPGDALTSALVLAPLLREGLTITDRYGRRLMPRMETVGELLAWQRGAALDQEREFVQYLLDKGARGSRPDCPWHEIEGVESPLWVTSPVQTPCAWCRQPIVRRIAKDGTVAVEDPAGGAHECAPPTDLTWRTA